MAVMLTANDLREEDDDAGPRRGDRDPVDEYFRTMSQMQAAIKRRDYAKAAAFTRENVKHVPAFVHGTSRKYGSFDIPSVPCLQEGGTMLALLDDADGLQELKALVDSHPNSKSGAPRPTFTSTIAGSLRRS